MCVCVCVCVCVYFGLQVMNGIFFVDNSLDF